MYDSWLGSHIQVHKLHPVILFPIKINQNHPIKFTSHFPRKQRLGKSSVFKMNVWGNSLGGYNQITVHGLFIVKARAVVPSLCDALFSITWKLLTPALLPSWLGNKAQPPSQYRNILSYRLGIPTHIHVTVSSGNSQGTQVGKTVWMEASS